MNALQPIKFDEQNRVLGPPKDMTDDECQPLPVFTDGKVCVSCWAVSPAEREAILATGQIWLVCHSGPSQPPVWVTVTKPLAPAP